MDEQVIQELKQIFGEAQTVEAVATLNSCRLKLTNEDCRPSEIVSRKLLSSSPQIGEITTAM